MVVAPAESSSPCRRADETVTLDAPPAFEMSGGPGSSSRMVIVVLVSARRAPAGTDRSTRIVSFGSLTPSSRISMKKLRSSVSPAAQVNVPLVDV